MIRFATLLSVALLSSCGMLPTEAELDARFDAGWRPPCAFGAPTPKMAAYCAAVNFGDEGAQMILRAENEKIFQSHTGELTCTDHVLLAKTRLSSYAGYTTKEVYSCSAELNGTGLCHVSLLVTDVNTKRSWVMDNGTVFDRKVYQGVGTLEEFKEHVGRYWFD